MLVGDVDLAVAEVGDPAGRPFLWGHGLTSSMAHEDDEPRIFDWSAAPARVVRYDARGHGQSAAVGDEDAYRWDNLAGDMLGLLDALGLERAVLGGASMGAATTLHAAVRAPGRVEAMVLVIPPTAWESRPTQARLYRIGAKTVQTIGIGAFVAAARVAPSPAIFRGPLAGARDSSLRAFGAFDKATLPTILRGAAASDLPPAEAIAALDIPTLVLAWDTDAGHPVSTAERLATLLPRAELHVAREPEEVSTWPARVAAFVG